MGNIILEEHAPKHWVPCTTLNSAITQKMTISSLPWKLQILYEFNFGSYWFEVTSTLHEVQITSFRFFEKQPVVQKNMGQVTSCMPCHNLHVYMSAVVLLCLRIMVLLSAVMVEAVIHTQWVVRTFYMFHHTVLTHSGHFIHSVVSCVHFYFASFCHTQWFSGTRLPPITRVTYVW